MFNGYKKIMKTIKYRPDSKLIFALINKKNGTSVLRYFVLQGENIFF